jgi:hypothetical protein
MQITTTETCMIKVALCAAHAVREVNGRGTMSESVLSMRWLSRASTAAAAMREGALAPSATGKEAAMRVGGINARITDDKVLQLVFRALNWDPHSLCVVARVSRRLRIVAERVLWHEHRVSCAFEPSPPWSARCSHGPRPIL